MTDTQEQQRIVTDIRWLYGKLASRDQLYLRNYNRFMSNGLRRGSIRSAYTNPIGYFNRAVDVDTGVLPAINVGRSITLTLASKLIQTKGRLFFSPVNGLWKTIKTARNAQIYFDAFIDRDKLNPKVKQCVIDAMVFEYGWIWVDDESKSTKRIKPWGFYADPAEVDHGKFSRCFVMEEDYPLIALKARLKPGSPSAAMLKTDQNTKVNVYHYFDLVNKKRYLIVNSEFVSVKDIKYDCIPCVPYYYEDPIKGMYSVSVMGNVYQNQRQIDSILYRIHDALELSPANTIYTPQSQTDATGNVPAKMISNKIGNVVEFNAALGVPQVVTPPAIDQQYLQMLQYFVQATYEQEGVSMLSAQSKKPAGADSGKALDTLQDVESERFQGQVDNLIQFYKDIYTTMIEVFPEDDDILPTRINRANIKWSEIKKQKDMFNLTSSLASVLSKDLKSKLEEIQGLAGQGILNPNMIASLLQFPDLEGAYSSATASYDNCLKIIERAIDQDRYDFLAVVNLKQLLEEAVNIILQLDSVDEKPEVLQRLGSLIEVVKTKMNTTASITAQANAQPTPPPKSTQDLAMNGAQLQAAADVAFRIGAGQITPSAGRAVLLAGFPNTPPELIDQIVGMAPPAPPVPPPVDVPPEAITPEAIVPEVPVEQPITQP